MSEAKVWDQLAGRYDKIVKFFDAGYPQVRERLAKDLSGFHYILEIASGTGQFTFDLSNMGTHFLATDVSTKMIEELNTKLAAKQLDHVETAVMNACQLELSDNELDAIFCANALHVMESPELALAEFFRTLRPGGRLILPTFCHGVDWRRRLLSSLLSLFSPFVAHSRFSPDSLVEIVSQAGFEIEKRTLLPGKFPLLYLVADKPK